MKKVLICDDEVDVVEALTQIIELTYENEIKVTKVTDSIDALVVITETRFDLIITDYKMPKLDGLELLTNVFTIKSSLNKNTPVFIVTGNARDIDSPIIEKENVTLFSKPIRGNELTDKIGILLGI